MRISLKGAIAAVKFAVVDAFTPSILSIAKAFAKIETAIEKAIAKQHRKLEKLANAEAAIRSARIAADRDLDAAYKLLNNVSELRN